MGNLALATRSAMANTAVSVVQLEGSLDFNTVGDFELLLQESFRKNQYKLILDMGKLTYISSAGIGVLMSVIKDVRKNKGDIKIANVSSEVYKVFDLLDMPGIFHFLKTENEAASEF